MWVNQLHDQKVVFKQGPTGSVWASERSVKDMLNKRHRPEKPGGHRRQDRLPCIPYAVARLVLDVDGYMAEFSLSSCPSAWPGSARELALWQIDGR